MKNKLKKKTTAKKKVSRNQAAVAFSEYRSILNSMSDAIHVIDADMKITLINKAFAKWSKQLGFSVSAIGKTPWEIFPFLPKAVKKEYKIVFKTAKLLVTEEKTIVNKKEVFTETQKIPLIDGGKVVQVATIVRDITERKSIENRLLITQKFSTSVINSLPGLFYVISADGKFVEWNNNLENITGYSSKEIQNMHPTEFFKGKDKKLIVNALKEAFSKGKNSVEADIVTKSGKRIPFFFHGIRAHINNRPYVIGTGFDVSERKHTEEMIRFTVEGTAATTGENFFRSIVKYLATALNVRYAFVGKLSDSNPGRIRTLAVWDGSNFSENFEYDLLGSPCENVVGKEMCMYKKDVQRLFPKDDMLINLQAESYIGTPMFDSSGKSLGLLAILDDNPLPDDHGVQACSLLAIFAARAMAELERMNAEAALRDSELQYRTLIEAAGDAIFLADVKTGYIVDANKGAEQLIGLPTKKIIGLHYTELHPKAESQYSREIFNIHSTTQSSSYKATAFIQHKSGKKIPVQISRSVVELQDKKLMIGIFRDITDLKQVEDSLRKDRDGLKQRVGEKVEELDRVQKRLEDARRLSEIGALATTIAHELRNPLGVMKTAVYNIKQKAKDSSQDRHISNIEKKISESEQIIRNLLGYAKIKVPNFEKVHVAKLMNDCIEQLQEKYKNPKIKVEFKQSHVSPNIVDADPVYLAELFVNIMDNAFQSFNDGRGKIAVDVNCSKKRRGGECKICVSDTGVGIDGDLLPKIYEPFFTTRSKGTGLGLSICNQIVTLHDGRIDVSSKKGEGTTVLVALPMKRK